MGVFDPTVELAHDPEPARLRILPIWSRRDGEPSHYIVIDRMAEISAEDAREVGQRMQNNVNVPVMIFAFEVELPDLDDDYRDGDEELVELGPRPGSACAYGC